MSKNFSMIALGIVGGVLLWLFLKQRSTAAQTVPGFPSTGGGPAGVGPSGGVSAGLAAGSGIAAAFARIFAAPGAPVGTTAGTVSGNTGIADRLASGAGGTSIASVNAGIASGSFSSQDQYDLAQAIATQSAGGDTATYATRVGPSSLGFGAPIVSSSPVTTAGAVDLSFLSPSLGAGPLPPAGFTQPNNSGVNASTTDFGLGYVSGGESGVPGDIFGSEAFAGA
jgi:hypothetical protein